MAGDVVERKRISVPAIDETVHEWWDRQHNPSESVRQLIRTEIARNGIADVAYGPVTQQPRRGRPAAEEAAEEQERPIGEAATPETAPVADAPAPTTEPVARPSASAVDPLDAIING